VISFFNSRIRRRLRCECLVKRDGTWVRSLQYGAYGALLRDTASASAPTWELRYRWTGREYDAETGWYFFRSRSYDPAARRFVQEDAIGYAGSSNVYAYGDGAPLDGRDPSGLMMDAIAYNNPKWEWLFRPRLPDVYIDGAFAGGSWLGFVMSMAQMNARYAEHVARTGRALLAAAGSGQHLSEDQKKALGNFCSLEPEVCSRAILTDDCGSISCWGAEALTWGGAINFQNGTNLGRTDQRFIASLAHELRHVCPVDRQPARL
jgi:RHS repeat-associated protein